MLAPSCHWSTGAEVFSPPRLGPLVKSHQGRLPGYQCTPRGGTPKTPFLDRPSGHPRNPSGLWHVPFRAQTRALPLAVRPMGGCLLTRLRDWLKRGPRGVGPPGAGCRTASDFYAITADPPHHRSPPVCLGPFWAFFLFSKNKGLNKNKGLTKKPKSI